MLEIYTCSFMRMQQLLLLHGHSPVTVKWGITFTNAFRTKESLIFLIKLYVLHCTFTDFGSIVVLIRVVDSLSPVYTTPNLGQIFLSSGHSKMTTNFICANIGLIGSYRLTLETPTNMYNTSELALCAYSQLNRFWHNLNHLQRVGWLIRIRTRIRAVYTTRLGLIRIPTRIKGLV